MSDCPDCTGLCCCTCPKAPLKGCNNCKSCQCDPCRSFLAKTRGLCCCVDEPLVCCACLEGTFENKCPTGYIGPWCQESGCPDCCSKCADCNLCSSAGGYCCVFTCAAGADGDDVNAESWGLFVERGIRIGRLTDCEDNACGGVWPCEYLIGWTCCSVCSVISLLAYSQNTRAGPFKRPHCGHGIAGLMFCPCALCLIRNNLRRRHVRELTSCAQCRDTFACLCCYPCLVAQFSRATYPWEWAAWHEVPAGWENMLPYKPGEAPAEAVAMGLPVADEDDVSPSFLDNDAYAPAGNPNYVHSPKGASGGMV